MNLMKRPQAIIHLLTAAALLGMLGCDGGDNKPDDNLCRADCGKDLAACVRACGPSDHTCITQCLDAFDMCRDDCHDQGGGQ